MSTDMALSTLKDLDNQVKSVEQKLPFFKRMKRRWLSGRNLVIWEVSGAVTGAKMLALFTMVVTPAKMAAYLAAEYPAIWSFTVGAWKTAVAAVIAVVGLAKELSPL